MRQQPKAEFIASCACGHRLRTREYTTQPASEEIICRNLCRALGTPISEKEERNDGYVEKKAVKMTEQLEELIYEERLKE